MKLFNFCHNFCILLLLAQMFKIPSHGIVSYHLVFALQHLRKLDDIISSIMSNVRFDFYLFNMWLQSMLSRADAKVKELRKSVDLLKAESEKLEVSLHFRWHLFQAEKVNHKYQIKYIWGIYFLQKGGHSEHTHIQSASCKKSEELKNTFTIHKNVDSALSL